MKLITALIKAYKAWRLRRAQEEYAYWKARHESLKTSAAQHGEFTWDQLMGPDIWQQAQIADQKSKLAEAAAQEAKYMERVEAFMRET